MTGGAIGMLDFRQQRDEFNRNSSTDRRRGERRSAERRGDGLACLMVKVEEQREVATPCMTVELLVCVGATRLPSTWQAPRRIPNDAAKAGGVKRLIRATLSSSRQIHAPRAQSKARDRREIDER